jgi:hypothetical protein
MIDRNADEFEQRKRFFLTKKKSKGNKYYFNFEEGGEKSIPSTGFRSLAEARVTNNVVPETNLRRKISTDCTGNHDMMAGWVRP